MSQTEFQRFVTAMQTTPALAETYSTATTPADLAGRLRADGYDVTEAEVQDGLRQAAASTGELSDEQLDGVAGGFLPPGFYESLVAARSRRNSGQSPLPQTGLSKR